MVKGVVIKSEEVKPLVLDDTYSSKMLLDSIVAGGETVQINEGTLKGGCRTGGGVHEKAEVYYIVKGEAELHLGDDRYDVGPGAVAYIPGGVFHYLVNKSATEDFVLLTFWLRAEDNEVYNLRVQKWGKSFKTIYED
jgi:mannose-6-phosphate isomerase-like protein (cupin superfamily)